jgi:hypothetical protein
MLVLQAKELFEGIRAHAGIWNSEDPAFCALFMYRERELSFVFVLLLKSIAVRLSITPIRILKVTVLQDRTELRTNFNTQKRIMRVKYAGNFAGYLYTVFWVSNWNGYCYEMEK